MDHHQQLTLPELSSPVYTPSLDLMDSMHETLPGRIFFYVWTLAQEARHQGGMVGLPGGAGRSKVLFAL